MKVPDGVCNATLLRFLTITAAILAGAGCQQIEVHPSIYDPQGIRDVKSWHVGFTYFTGAQVETASRAGEVEQTTVQREVPRKDDLQFRDDFEFRLRDQFNIRTTREMAVADGTVSVHLMYYVFVGIKSADVLITDRGGKVLARLKIVNGQRRTAIRNYAEFAQRCADEVGKVLRP